jgi:4-amino-4-deoxy-L-arabinose transferase-like glycosyltransferase
MRPAPSETRGRGGDPRGFLISQPPTQVRRFALGTGLLLLASTAVLFPALGQAPFERAEIYFMDGARAMVESGDYLMPRYRGEPFFDKPALTYWLMAASFRLFGFTAAAARLVPAVAALCVILATIWLGTLLVGRAAALAGGVCLATTGAFMAFGRVAMSDMILTLWTTLALGLAVLMLRGGPAHWPALALGAVLGLGFQTKGPLALLLPGLGIAWLSWRTPRPRPRIARLSLLLGAAAFLVLGFGWFVAVFARLGPAPLAHFFLRENLARFAGETYDSGRAPWYYLVTYLALGVPWSVFLPLAAWRLLRGSDTDKGSRLLLIWMGLMAIPLSLSRGKIDYYLLPLYPAASLVVGRYFTAVPWRALDVWWSRAALLLAAIGLGLVTVMVGGLPAGWLPGPGGIRLLFLLVLAGSGAAALVALRASPRRVLVALAGMAFALFLVFTVLFLPPFRAAQPNLSLVKDVMRERQYRPDARLALCSDPARVQRDLLFFGRLSAQEQCDLWAPASSEHAFLILASRDESASLASIPGIRDVAGYAYLPATALTLRGLLAGPRPDTLKLLANYATSDPVAEAKWKRDRRKALKAVYGSGP